MPAAGAEMRLWQTPEPLEEDLGLADRSAWRELHVDALTETHVLPADAVVESGGMTALFLTRQATLVLLVGSEGGAVARVRIAPSLAELSPETVQLAALRTPPGQGAGSVALRFDFTGQGTRQSLTYTFRDGTVLLAPSGVETICISAPLSYVIVPTLAGDDLIFDPRHAGCLERWHIPAENVLVGLLAGEDALVTACWSGQVQEGVTLDISRNETGEKQICSAQIAPNGQTLHVGLARHPRIWHRQPVDLSGYEKPTPTGWRAPFSARWITQFGYGRYGTPHWQQPPPLLEYDGIVSTFAFADNPAKRRWKATVGWHEWPCWFQDREAYVQIGKKIKPPAQDLLFYFLERSRSTPATVEAPFDLVRAALPDADAILGLSGRKTRPLNRPGAVYGEPTCGTTERLAKVFERGNEVRERERVAAVAGDLAWYFDNMEGRLDDFEAFAAALRRLCIEVSDNQPKLQAFIEDLDIESTLQEIDSAVNLSGLRPAMRPDDEILGDLVALAEEHTETSLARYLKLRAEITHRGGILDSCAARADFLVRGLAQKAGYRCVDDPGKVRFAEAVRRLAKQHLANPTPWEQAR